MDVPIEQLKTTIFHTMMKSFSHREDELTDGEIKEIIFQSIRSFPEFSVKWGTVEKFGRNRLLVLHENRIAILDVNLLIGFIKDVWKHYLAKTKVQ